MISTSQLEADIRQEVWTFFSTESFKSNSLLKIINSWVRKVCQAANWKFNDYTLSITTDWITEEYTIPKWYKIYAIKVWWVSWEYIPVDFETYFSNDDNEDLKQIWFKQEKLYTKLALTMTLVYRWMPSRLYTLDWNIDLPEDTYDILLDACIYYAYLSCKQYTRANKRVEDFKNEVNRVKAMETDPFPRQPTRMWRNYSLRSK